MEEKRVLMIAVIQARDSEETVSALTESGYYVTVLSTTGGFLKQKNTTLMIGTTDAEREKVMAILKAKAGVRQEADYSASMFDASPDSEVPMQTFTAKVAPPIMRSVGGAAVFTINVEEMEKI